MEHQQIGPFLVYEKLGTHRRHHVYHARQAEQEREVALKFIRIPNDLPLESALQKIKIESEQLKDLSHPNLVKFYGAGIEDERIFFASRLIKGESLSALLGRRSRLAPDMVIDYAKQVAACLGYLHENDLVHSKLTPDKIMIDRRGVVRCIDIRLNRARKKRWDAPRRHQMEIAAYMAPEVLTGRGSTRQSDFYSLGVIMYEMLTGELPFEPDTLGRMIRKKKNDSILPISEFSMNCPVWLQQVVSSLLNPHPKQRPDSAAEIVEALDEIKAFDKQRKSSFFQYHDRQRKRPGLLQDANANGDCSANQATLTEDSDRPFYQRGWIVTLCLLLLISTMVLATWISTLPASNEKLFVRAEALAESKTPKDLARASHLFRQIVDRQQDDDISIQAEQKHFELEQQLLLIRVDKGILGSASSTIRAFARAYQAEREGEFENAIQRYRHLVQTTDNNGPDRHVYHESLTRAKALEIRVTEIEIKISKIDDLIRDARMAITYNDFAKARRILNSIIDQYATDPDLRWVVERARSELRKLDS